MHFARCSTCRSVRIIGGLIVVVIGLNLMGVLRIGLLNRTFGPQREFGEAPVGGAAAHSPLAALALGGVFALAHTPCVGPTLGAILGLSLALGAAPQVILLLLGYSLGIGIPFLALALALDGSARLTRPFLQPRPDDRADRRWAGRADRPRDRLRPAERLFARPSARSGRNV